MIHHPYVVTISSEKGGVGKTTLATNLAIYLKAQHEDLPVTLLSFDNHFSVDRMFRIGSGHSGGSVLDLFDGRKADELLEIGQYGVQFIASCGDLEALGRRIEDVSCVAKALAEAELTGIVIIDTRPILDIFTRNALYAADRIIIPVKDAPSLENCRHLYDFCEKQGLSKRSLRLLPCLIDSRIRYKGPFKDAYQLVKAYAINRGYRCLEGFIAKSPKVESLNTNPEGKIYPILTHGKSTNVHLQFSFLARQIFLDAKDCTEPRLKLFRQSLLEKQAVREEAEQARRNQIGKMCLVCGQPMSDDVIATPGTFYCETSDNRKAGYIEEECFSGLVFRHFYRSQKEITPTDPLRELFRESAQRSYFALRPVVNETTFDSSCLAFYRLDENGLEISKKVVELKEFQTRFLHKERSKLYHLAAETLLGKSGTPDGRFVLIRRVGPTIPGTLPVDEQRRHFEETMDLLAERWS